MLDWRVAHRVLGKTLEETDAVVEEIEACESIAYLVELGRESCQLLG